MKKFLYGLFLTLIIFTTRPMESQSKELNSSGMLKMEKSASYSNQVIEIMQTHLEVVKNELTKNNIPKPKKNFLKQNLEVTSNAIGLIKDSPCYTYLVLQSSSKGFTRTYSTISVVSVKSDIYFDSLRNHFSTLDSLYKKITQEAYEEISTRYSVETILLLNDLLLHNNSAREKKSTLTEKTYTKSLKESSDILQILDQVIKSPSNTYSILQAYHEENKQIPLEVYQTQSSDPETHFIQDRCLLIGKLSELYKKIIEQ